MPNYGDIAYWNKRYKDQAGTTYDWLLNYEHFREIIKQHLLAKKYAIMLNEFSAKRDAYNRALIARLKPSTPS